MVVQVSITSFLSLEYYTHTYDISLSGARTYMRDIVLYGVADRTPVMKRQLVQQPDQDMQQRMWRQAPSKHLRGLGQW